MAKTQILRVKDIGGICDTAARRLDELFPKGIPLVPSSVDKIVEAGLDPTDAMFNLIPNADLLMDTPEWAGVGQSFSQEIDSIYEAKRAALEAVRQKKCKAQGRLVLKALLEARTKGG
jgi:hypothetical protein